MKISFQIQNRHNPYIKAVIENANKTIFGEVNSMLNTNIGYNFKEEYENQYDNFITLTIDDKIKQESFDKVLEIIDSVKERIQEKFQIPKELILINFKDNDNNNDKNNND